MMTMVPLPIVKLSSKLGTYLLVDDAKEVRFCCPFCLSQGKPSPDTKYHLYVHTHQDNHYGRWICHRCQARGRSIDILARAVGISALTGTTVPLNILDEVERVFASDEPKAVVVPTVDLPPRVLFDTSYTQANEYVHSRGLTSDDISYYRLKVGTGRAGWRIVIPNFGETGPNFWQARSYMPFIEPKYLSPAGAYSSLVLFNYLRLDKKLVVICEGPISAMVAGHHATCVYGKNVSPYQLHLLLKLEANEYVVAFDGDATLESVALATWLYSRGARVKRLLFKQADDPASVGRNGMTELVESTPVFSDYDAVSAILEG